MIEVRSAVVVLAVLAVWRVTHLLVAEEGPWRMFARARRGAAAMRLDRLANCFYCASVWIAVPFALLVAEGWREIAITIPALSGGAIVVERLTARDGEAAVWFEEEDRS